MLAGAWAIYTLFTYHRSRRNAFFIAFIDLCFVGAFIAGVYELRGINHDNCSSITNEDVTVSGGVFGTITYTGLGLNISKTCSMLKASWVFGIMNCIMFFFTSVLALFHGNGDRRDARNTRSKEVYVRETHSSRHGHRRSTGGSHRSHRSSHSRQRGAYV